MRAVPLARPEDSAMEAIRSTAFRAGLLTAAVLLIWWGLRCCPLVMGVFRFRSPH